MKVAIVTGISRGLGAAIAKRLLQSGYSVFGLGRTDNSELKTIALQSRASYDFQQLDLLDLAALENSLKKSFAKISALNPDSITLINNAAIVTPIGLLGDLHSAEIQQALNVNLVAPIILSNAFIASFQTGGHKRIIHISSVAAVRTLPGSNTYCIAKAGLEMLVKAIHSESQHLASPIESIAFRPGLVDTDMQTSLRDYSPTQLPIVGMYQDFKDQGILRQPEVIAQVLIDKLVNADVESGRIYSIDEWMPGQP